MSKRAMRLIGLLALISVCGFFLTGCWKSAEINQLSIVMGIAIDAGSKPGRYLITTQIVRPSQIKTTGDSSSGDTPHVNIQQKEATGINMAIREMMRPLSRKLNTAHNQVIILSDEVAREGIAPILDYFIRSHEGRLTVKLMIAEGEANEILDEKVELEQLPAMHLKKLIEGHATDSYVAETTLFSFLADMVSLGTSPTAPVVGLYKDKEGNKKAEFVGTAVFADGKLVGTLTSEQTRAMQLVKNSVDAGSRTIDAFGSYVSLDVTDSSTTITPRIEDGRIIIALHLRQQYRLIDIGSEANIMNDDVKAQIQKIAAQDIIADIEELIHTTKELGADVCGFGEAAYRKFPKQSESLMRYWPEAYAQLEVEYDVETLIVSSGAVLQPMAPRGEQQ